MNSKATALAVSAAIIGGFAALVTALAAGQGRARPAPATDGAPPAQPATQPATQPAAQSTAQSTASDPQAGGPTGPTAARPSAPAGGEGHAAPDLAADADRGPGHRAPEAFRPDMDAPMTAAEREALRPATAAPSLTGASTSQPAGS